LAETVDESEGLGCVGVVEGNGEAVLGRGHAFSLAGGSNRVRTNGCPVSERVVTKRPSRCRLRGKYGRCLAGSQSGEPMQQSGKRSNVP
jgi:hypothetical protein